MASVFLSYSRDDVAKAQAVAAALEERGHSVWWDRQLHGGSRFSKEIERALKSSDAVLVLWSRASVESAWVQDEAAEGRDSGRLIPAVIDDCKPPLGFRQYQAVDLSAAKGKKSSDAIDQVHRAIVAKTGDVRPAEAAPGPRIKGARPRFALLGAAALVIAAGLLIYWLWAPAGRSDSEARLYLGEMRAITPDVPDSVPAAFREELLAALATDAAIVATSQKQAGKAAARFSLTATVRKVDNLLRFTVHLANDQGGGTVWTEVLDGSDSPAIATRQIAVSVSQVLRCGLGGVARHGKPLPDETMTIYMNFCEEFWADTAGKELNPARIVDLARRLTEAAPDFSRGWSALAEVATWANNGGSLQSPDSLRAQAIDAAERALDLDPQNSEAYQALASLQPPFAFAEREKFHIKSVSVRPSDCGCEYVGYGGFLNRVGRNLDAVTAYKRARDMIPLSADVNTRLAGGLYVAGRSEEAAGIAAEVQQIWPNYPIIRQIMLRDALRTGQFDEAVKLIADPKSGLSPREKAALGLAVQALRNGNAAARASAVDAIMPLGQEASSKGPLMVTVLAVLGADREALLVADQQIKQNGSAGLAVLFEPSLANARRTPQFGAMMSRYGLQSYWKSSGKRPDFCNERDAPALCAAL